MKETIEQVTPNIKSLNIPFSSIGGRNQADVELFLDNLPKQKLQQADWLTAEKKPQINFAIGYCRKAMLLKFYITEPHFRATYLNANEPVSQDSCVEFFISFDDRQHYYNLEFNAFGTCLAAYGSNRTNRENLPSEIIEEIKFWQKWEQFSPDENIYEWEITFSIPLSIFKFDDFEGLKGTKAYANFYKCGDALPEPHYLVWNRVATLLPDFHQPTYFGLLNFE
jgi:hypothetical protein